ncbi:unnamed protein product, partial [Ectocarpus sp. 8 AP-2014]
GGGGTNRTRRESCVSLYLSGKRAECTQCDPRNGSPRFNTYTPCSMFWRTTLSETSASNSLDNMNGVLCGIKKEGKKMHPHRVPQSTECRD